MRLGSCWKRRPLVRYLDFLTHQPSFQLRQQKIAHNYQNQTPPRTCKLIRKPCSTFTLFSSLSMFVFTSAKILPLLPHLLSSTSICKLSQRVLYCYPANATTIMSICYARQTFFFFFSFLFCPCPIFLCL